MLKLLARFCARPAVATWIIRRALGHPYHHLDGYMGRWWFFNPYEDVDGADLAGRGWCKKCQQRRDAQPDEPA